MPSHVSPSATFYQVIESDTIYDAMVQLSSSLKLKRGVYVEGRLFGVSIDSH
jgi:hypothetical protein